MPIYEFCCLKCCAEFDELVSGMTANPKVKCPTCGSKKVQKKMSLFGTSGVSKPATSVAGGSGGGCSGCRKSKCTSCK